MMIQRTRFFLLLTLQEVENAIMRMKNWCFSLVESQSQKICNIFLVFVLRELKIYLVRRKRIFVPFELCYCFVESTAMGCQSPSFHAVFFSSLLSSAMTTNHHILAGLSPCTMWPDKLHPKMPQLWCYHISICFASYSRRRHSNGSVQLTFGISFQLPSVHFDVDQHVCT